MKWPPCAASSRSIPATTPCSTTCCEKAKDKGQYVEDVFGSQRGFYKHPLVEASPLLRQHLRRRRLRREGTALPAQGIRRTSTSTWPTTACPARALTMDEKMKSRQLLRGYAANLLGFEPDYVFTHVTRLVPSKGLWRDIRVLEQLEKHMARENKTAVLFVLSTETIGRARHDVGEHGTLVQVARRPPRGPPGPHRRRGRLLCRRPGMERQGPLLQDRLHQPVRGQRPVAGQPQPPDMEFLDFRKGSDAEFGQSIYEPFGIAQVEPISFGGICVFTNVCGCAGFVRKAAGRGRRRRRPNQAAPMPSRSITPPCPSSCAPRASPTCWAWTAMPATRSSRPSPRKWPPNCSPGSRGLPRILNGLVASGAKLRREMNWDAVAQLRPARHEPRHARQRWGSGIARPAVRRRFTPETSPSERGACRVPISPPPPMDRSGPARAVERGVATGGWGHGQPLKG